jgi:predicted SprT family Zn-dependent metalloprotease
MGFDFATSDNSGKDDSEPDFGDEMGHRKFREACEEYAEWAVEEYDELSEVDLKPVRVEVSDDLKRTAGKAGKRSDDYFIRFATGAYEEWGWSDQMKSTIRHELIHIHQYQETGSGDHGIGFRRIANKIGCEVHCQKFTDYNFQFYCTECGEESGGRYRECKATRNPEKYRSKCCKAPLRVEEQ